MCGTLKHKFHSKENVCLYCLLSSLFPLPSWKKEISIFKWCERDEKKFDVAKIECLVWQTSLKFLLHNFYFLWFLFTLKNMKKIEGINFFYFISDICEEVRVIKMKEEEESRVTLIWVWKEHFKKEKFEGRISIIHCRTLGGS